VESAAIFSFALNWLLRDRPKKAMRLELECTWFSFKTPMGSSVMISFFMSSKSGPYSCICESADLRNKDGQIQSKII
jgi:hypothetical protein